MKFVLVPAGRFSMGSPENEVGRNANEKLHPVVLGRPFYLEATGVTQLEYFRVMGSNPSGNPDPEGRVPVDKVSWLDAIEFCNRLTQAEGGEPLYEIRGRDVLLRSLSSACYRLPTEAEWEYACRAGTATPYWTGTNLPASAANFDARDTEHGQTGEGYVGRTTPVDAYPPNPWGLFDMHGNVGEWCWDYYGEYPEGAVSDPIGPKQGTNRIFRGGSWISEARNCRSAKRSSFQPGYTGTNVGFRLVRTIPT